MSRQSGKSPRSKQSSQHPISRLLSFLQVEKLLTAQQRHLEREKQQVAIAKLPWLKLLCLFSLYFLIGFLVSFLLMPWGFIGWIAVVFISMVLIAEAFNILMIESECQVMNILSSIGIALLAKPLEETIEALSNVMKRWIFRTTPSGFALDVKLDLVPVFCFFAIFLIEGLGLWLGYLTKTQFF